LTRFAARPDNHGVTKVYFILGCTAVGKGAIGRELARRIGGQIVSVDSMKVYRRMDIGTGKPSAEDRAAVGHHCIDVAEPSEGFSVAQYVACADEAIGAIAAAGAIPLAVGGTSLYIKALSEGLFDGPAGDPSVRAELKARIRREGLAALHGELVAVDAEAGRRIHPNDQRRIIRALEVYRASGVPISRLQRQWDSGSRRYDCVFVGLRRDKAELHRRINARVKRMAEGGLREEVAGLLAEPAGVSPQAAQAVGYAEMIAHLQGRMTFEEALESIKVSTRKLAKKQRTWHRRWTDLLWFDLAPEATIDGAVEIILRSVKFN
jgi:tRNA dimethylallyltransferase